MSSRLRQYLFDAYEYRHRSAYSIKIDVQFPIQIDDQDDNDKLDEFCNIFCMVGRNNSFTIELIGSFPITQPMADLAEIYNGSIRKNPERLSLVLNIQQIEAIMDLADKIRKTSFIGETTNPNWLSISARTISSLYRFVRIIKEYPNSINKIEVPY